MGWRLLPDRPVARRPDNRAHKNGRLKMRLGKLVLISAFAIMVVFARVEMANAYYQQLDASQATEKGGAKKADKSDNANRPTANSNKNSDSSATTKTSTNTDANTRISVSTNANTKSNTDANTSTNANAN